MLVGYIRAMVEDTSDRSEQRHALQRAGCRDIVEETVSADGKEWPELQRLLGRLRRGDMAVVAWLGVLGPSLRYYAVLCSTRHHGNIDAALPRL